MPSKIDGDSCIPNVMHPVSYIHLPSNKMAYRPPVSSFTSSSYSSSDAFPMKRRQQNRVDAEGWEHVNRSQPAYAASATATKSRWGQSALPKSQPKPKTHEEEYPALGGASKKQQQQQQSTTPPYPPATPEPPKLPTSTSSNSLKSSASASSLSMAERMKIKLAEEEAERLRREEAEANRAAQDEKERARITGFVPMLSILQSRRVQTLFEGSAREDDDLLEPLDTRDAYDAYGGNYGSDCYDGESDYVPEYEDDNEF